MKGALESGGGLDFVLKRPSGNHPEWLQSVHRRDFHFGFKEVRCLPVSWEAAYGVVTFKQRCMEWTTAAF